MKKTLILVVTLFNFAYGFGQCDFDKDHFDPFTHCDVVQTESKGFYANGMKSGFDAYFTNQICHDLQGEPGKRLHIGFANTRPFSISEGEQVIVLFEDASRLFLESLGGDIAAPRDFSNQILGKTQWSIDQQYLLSDSDLQELKTKRVKGIRFYTDTGYLQYILNKKPRGRFQTFAACFAEKIK